MSKNNNTDGAAVFFGCFAIVLLGLVLVLEKAWVLSVLWGWFMVPLFDMPPLTIPFAIGLSLVAGLFMPTSFGDNNDKSTEDQLAILIYHFLMPLVSLVIGYIVLMFM